MILPEVNDTVFCITCGNPKMIRPLNLNRIIDQVKYIVRLHVVMVCLWLKDFVSQKDCSSPVLLIFGALFVTFYFSEISILVYWPIRTLFLSVFSIVKIV